MDDIILQEIINGANQEDIDKIEIILINKEYMEGE